MKKYVVWTLTLVLLLSACGRQEGLENQVPSQPTTEAPLASPSPLVPPSTEPVATEETSPTPLDIDLSSYFGETAGCAIFLTSSGQEYVHGGDWIDTRFSPYSTFKIVSTLMGLEEGIVTSAESTMAYDGSTYWYDPWNANLNLAQAFQHSCVWFYHQVIYQLPQQTVQVHLDSLPYGNQDLSQWEGNGQNPKPDLNGFWLNSSLKISPREQVLLLRTLFEGETAYAPSHIQLLRDLMATETPTIYGKTGSGSTESWYVGYFEYDSEIVYYATFLSGEDVSGAFARELSFAVIEDWPEVHKDALTTQN